MVPVDLSLRILLLVLMCAFLLGRLTKISLLSRRLVHVATLMTVGDIELLIYMRLLEHRRRLGTLRPNGPLTVPLLSTFLAHCIVSTDGVDFELVGEVLKM